MNLLSNVTMQLKFHKFLPSGGLPNLSRYLKKIERFSTNKPLFKKKLLNKLQGRRKVKNFGGDKSKYVVGIIFPAPCLEWG